MAGLLSRLISDRDPLLLSAVALVSINSAAHLLASLTKDRKVHDVFTTGSLVASAATSLGVMAKKCGDKGEALPLRPIILTAAVTIWGIRLGTHLARRDRLLEAASDSKEDDEYRISLSEPPSNVLLGDFPTRYGGDWLTQSAWSWIALLPVTMACRHPPSSAPMDLAALLSIGGCVGGIAFEAVADHQKTVSKRQKGQEGMWVDSGLWYYSRHPNYFGETMFWSSLYLVASKAIPTWTAASPAFVVLWIYNITVTNLEHRYDTKFNANHDYFSYKWDTSVLLPWPKPAPIPRDDDLYHDRSNHSMDRQV
mmetsp:Transcript_54922/g.128430  ORF Transcript_54922/g.128430 Transcript_54922/m.128430 type:complete len:310 (+) Transcript_54922:90-1019(+)